MYEPQQPPRITGDTIYVVEGYVEHTHRRLGRELADLEQNAQMLELSARGNFASARSMAAVGVAAERRPQRMAVAH